MSVGYIIKDQYKLIPISIKIVSIYKLRLAMNKGNYFLPFFNDFEVSLTHMGQRDFFLSTQVR